VWAVIQLIYGSSTLVHKRDYIVIYLLLDALEGSVTGRASSEGLDLAHSTLSNRLATGSVTGL
jgi:hypothetical protein